MTTLGTYEIYGAQVRPKEDQELGFMLSFGVSSLLDIDAIDVINNNSN
jgi:hypothetical protein